MTMPKGAPPRTLPIGNITRDGYGHAQECPCGQCRPIQPPPRNHEGQKARRVDTKPAAKRAPAKTPAKRAAAKKAARR